MSLVDELANTLEKAGPVTAAELIESAVAEASDEVGQTSAEWGVLARELSERFEAQANAAESDDE